MNPIQMLKGILGRGLTPQQIVQNMTGARSNPMINNLVSMAQKGDTQGVEKFARNMFKEQGRDFDAEFSQFMSNFK